MAVCQVCQSIDIRDLLESFHGSEAFDGVVTYSSPLDYLGVTENYQPHHSNFAALRDAAKAGCGFCGMVVAHHHKPSRWQHDEDDCECNRFLGPVRLAVFQDDSDHYAALHIIIMSEEKEPMPAWVITKLEICVAKDASIPEEDGHLLARLARDERPKDLSSELCLAMGASWLNKCLHEHPECTAKAEQRLPSALPTRVINVGTASQKPFLHVSAEDEVGQWAALSYCWGGDSPFTLNATSFARLRDGLPLEDFPPTLRDAILVVRALEVRYVWIDSLCIFQDDPQDWAFEASMMAKVYEFAVVTVAATSAESVVDGFLGRRDPHFSCGFPWRRRAGVDEDDAYPVVLGGVSRKFDAQLDEDKSRWATRGWTFQEQLLSTRLLCYTTGRMIWYCAAGQAIEPSNDAERRPTLFSELKQLLVSPTMENPGLDSEESPYDIWYRLLSEYSKRRLTFSKDRLPAIAALARMFHARQQDQYVAGLWRDDLTYGLLWSPDDQTDGSVKTAKPLRYALLRYASFYADTESTNVKPVDPAASVQVPSQSHGPSWSWIDSCFSGLRWPPRYEPFTYLARATDVKVTTALPDDSFGSVTSSELVLEAPYQHVNLKLGSYAGPLWNPANLTQRVLSRLGPLAKTRELAQIALTRPGSLASSSTGRSVEAPFSGTQFTLVQVARSDAHRPMIFLLVLQPHAVADGSWGGEGGAREVYRRVARLVLQPWQYDDENSIAEEVMNRLEGEAYAEVAGEGWPRGKFVIV